MIEGYFGLVGSFVVLASLVLLIFIKPKTPIWIKAVLIPVVIWYGFALFFSTSSLLGWPKNIDDIYGLPDKCVIFYVGVVEPSRTNEGGIYLLVYPLIENEEVFFSINPKKTFEYRKDETKYFKIKYDEELSKELQKKKKKKSESNGIIVFTKPNKTARKADGKEGQEVTNNEKDAFKILTIGEQFNKEEQ